MPLPFIESSANRRKWLLCLEFSYTHTLGVSNLDEQDLRYSTIGSTVDEDEDQLWSRVHIKLVPSPRLTDLIRGQALDVRALIQPGEQLGIPHYLRSHIWPRLTGALEKLNEARKRTPPLNYSDLIQLSSEDTLLAGVQIEKVVLFTIDCWFYIYDSTYTNIYVYNFGI